MTHGGNLEGSIKQKFFMRAEVAHGAINRARREKSLAEVGEVEVEGEGIALRGIHVNGGGAGGKVFGVEVEPQSGADEEAAAVLRAGEIGLAGRREGPELPVFAGNLNVEIFPEVIGTRDEAGGRTGARTGRTNNISTVRIGELDLHHDSYEFGLIAMIECGLLGAVVGLPTGMLNEKSERSEESDGGDVRAGFGRPAHRLRHFPHSFRSSRSAFQSAIQLQRPASRTRSSRSTRIRKNHGANPAHRFLRCLYCSSDRSALRFSHRLRPASL